MMIILIQTASVQSGQKNYVGKIVKFVATVKEINAEDNKIEIYAINRDYESYDSSRLFVCLSPEEISLLSVDDKIGVVGELYSIMEPFSSNYIEQKLSSYGIEVHRFTTLTYLLFQKKYKLKKACKKSWQRKNRLIYFKSFIEQPKGKGGLVEMSTVRVGENENIDSALRRFKRKCSRDGIIGDLRKKEHYEKPSVKKKKKSEAARKRSIKG